MSFGEAVQSVFSKYATFSGRARRSEYWYFALFNLIVSVAMGIVLGLVGASDGTIETVSRLYSLAVFLPALAVSWRRLHDLGKSGAFWFLNFIPLVGQIILIIWFAKAGQEGENEYGPDPKNPQPEYAEREKQPWEY